MEHLNVIERGQKGEYEVTKILKQYQSIEEIRKPDLCILVKDLWLAIEVKNKEPFNPPPKFMQGMPKSQYLKDLKMTELGMPCILCVKGINNEWLAQWIMKLKPEPDPRTHIISKDKIVWFGLEQFKTLTNFCKVELEI